MKYIYRLLIILMALVIFIAVYVVVKDDQFSNLDSIEQKTTSKPQSAKHNQYSNEKSDRGTLEIC